MVYYRAFSTPRLPLRGALIDIRPSICGGERNTDVLNPSANRRSHDLNWLSIECWLRERMPELGMSRDTGEPMHVERCVGGHSNLTFTIRFGSQAFILRTAPPGPLPHAAHDMAREYRWLATLHPIFPLAPRPYVLCDDPAVTGSAFYVMERRHGIVVRADEPPSLDANPALRRRVGDALVDSLATLHHIDIDDSGIAHLGRASGFVTRQLKGWSERWERFKTSDMPEIDAIARWLHAHEPPETEAPGIVHGDFKLDNVLLDAERLDRVVAVFDWEMSALGDPLIDLGMLLAYWVSSAPPGHRDALTTVTDRPGWPSRQQIIDRYAAQSGRNLRALPFFEAFAFFKIAVVLQQIYYRYVNGQADDPRFAVLNRRVGFLAQSASRLIERG
jgi:aminoglycoside phosphotransferase (APT) family kinase protein